MIDELLLIEEEWDIDWTNEEGEEVSQVTLTRAELIGLLKAQLAKAKPFIEKQERERIIKWIDKRPIFIQSNSLGIKVPIAIDTDWQALKGEKCLLPERTLTRKSRGHTNRAYTPET